MKKEMMLVGRDADIGEASAPNWIAPEAEAATAGEGYGNERCVRATPRIVTDVPIARALYDEDERPTTVSPRHRAPEPLPPLPIRRRPRFVRSPAVAMHDQRVLVVSVYEDRLGDVRLRGRDVYWAGLVCGIVIALLVIWLGPG